jgi:phosphoesterase RecJ-like protein
MFDAVRPYLATPRRALLISHLAPDGDAIGSQLGLMWFLAAQGWQVVPANQDGVPPFLKPVAPGWEVVVTAVAPQSDFDLVIALDCSDLPRLGRVFDSARYGALPLLNIDHHVTNLMFGAANLVDSLATSTCELVYRLSLAMGWPLSPAAAQCLLTGVVSDTLGFRTSNVTASLLGIAQVLMEAGASLALVNENVFQRSTLASICLWGRALVSTQVEDRIIWTAIPLDDRAQCYGVEQSDTGLASFLVAAEEADVSVVLTERKDGKVDIGMRAKPGFDVAQVALTLGGGGHPQAAGCTLHLGINQAQQRVLAALRTALAEQRATRLAMRDGRR